MVVLASVTQKLHQAATDISLKLATDGILTIEDVDRVASTQLGFTLCLAASSFNGLPDKKKGVIKTSR